MNTQEESFKEDISPSKYAEQMGWEYASKNSSEFKKMYGQYMTPPSVAIFMSQLLNYKKNTITFLDPGAGTGVLSCAVLETVGSLINPPKNIKLVLYEIDKEIISYLERSLEYSKRWLERKKIHFSYQIKTEDFILTNTNAFNSENTLFSFGNKPDKFDYIISNPPYFKLSKSDIRAKIASKIVYGQPNIYAVFMFLAALLLNNDGELVFITPRSYTAGPYFKAFREHFFTIVQPTYIHLFGSRKDAFDQEAILQENIILKAVKDHTFEKPNATVAVSFSKGIKGLEKVTNRNIPIQDIIDLETKNKVLRIPVTEKEDQVVEFVHSWKENLHSLGLNISTGPVVAFRATEYIKDNGQSNGHNYAPLFWMQNIKAMDAKWPANSKKKQFIEDSERTRTLLIPNKNYVVIRRFSAKEEAKRLVAAPYLSTTIKSDLIGLENHLNYIYRPQGDISIEETIGLSALLNSSLLDIYFRTSNGNTQVSATELRDMPLPTLEVIKDIGKKIMKNQLENSHIDKLVENTLAMGV